jgi:putative endonuclease
MSAWVYMLRLQSGRLYVGWTTNVERRFSEHLAGKGGRTTRLDPPSGVEYTEKIPDIDAAKNRENQFKRWTRAKKEALVRGDLLSLKTLAKRRRTLRPRLGCFPRSESIYLNYAYRVFT